MVENQFLFALWLVKLFHKQNLLVRLNNIYHKDWHFGIVFGVVGVECISNIFNKSNYWRYFQGECELVNRYNDRFERSDHALLGHGAYWYCIFIGLLVWSLHWSCVLLEAVHQRSHLHLSIVLGHCADINQYFVREQIL